MAIFYGLIHCRIIGNMSRLFPKEKGQISIIAYKLKTLLASWIQRLNALLYNIWSTKRANLSLFRGMCNF